MSEDTKWGSMMGQSAGQTFVYNFSGIQPVLWEYKWVRPGDLTPALMNAFGSVGWEYVGLFGGDWAIFKRPLPSEASES